jgi:hypothetical protein
VSYHQYADDTQLYTAIDLSTSVNLTRLSDCANAVAWWHYENGLLLNPSMTEALVTGTQQQVASFDYTFTLRVDEDTALYLKTVRILGVTLDPHQTMKDCNPGSRHCTPLKRQW